MKRIILICLLAIIGASAFSQPVVQRANKANTVADGRFMANLNAYIPRYADTLTANTQIGIDSSGAVIYTYDIKGFWYRQDNPKKWVRVVSNNNLSNNFFFDSTCNCYKIDTASLVNIINNFNADSTITSISIINDSTLRICFGNGTCVNIGIHTTINNISNVYFLGGDSIAVCALDTVGGVVTTVCDTLTIGIQPVTTTYQNWIRNQGGNIIEFGSNSPSSSPGLFLSHNTYANTAYQKMYFQGFTVYDYPYTFEQQQSFKVSTAIAAFLHNSNSNIVRLGFNFTDSVYETTPSYVPGYMGNTHSGYWLGTNLTGTGSYGIRFDDANKKYSGMFFHVADTLNNDAITFYGGRPKHTTYLSTLEASRAMTIFTNGDLRLYSYDSTRNDGALTKALGTDANGKVILGTVGANAFTETTQEFTGGTSLSFTVSNTPLLSKARMIFFNGVLMQNVNVSISGSVFTISGITREVSDVITIKYSY